MSSFVSAAKAKPVILGPPPTGLTESALSSSGLTGVPRSDLVQFGRPFWKLVAHALGTSRETADAKKGKGKLKKATSDEGLGSIPDEMIKIPVDVTPQNLKKFTLYDLLGFSGELANSADESAIRRAYHKCVLMYHPDKKQDKKADGAEDNSVWLKIQLAFSTLLDKDKRRAYDSQLPFKEDVPSDEDIAKALGKSEAHFYKLYDKVFKRNARFAEKKPVPEIGNADTPFDEVDAFYAYWVKFDSWRDFTGVDAEYRPEEASSREEKRYMIKENAKQAEKLKKKVNEWNDLCVNFQSSTHRFFSVLQSVIFLTDNDDVDC